MSGTFTAVLGLGVLVVPAALGPAGKRTVVLSLLVAAVLALWCLPVAAAGGTAGRGAVGFATSRLGPAVARPMGWLYVLGFASGQAAVALTGGRFLGEALGFGERSAPFLSAPFLSAPFRAASLPAAVLPSTALPLLTAALLLLTAALRSAAALRSRLRGPRLYAALTAAVCLWWGGGPPSAGGPHPGPVAGTAAAALPLLFTWVGLENAVPPLRERRRLLGTLLALAVTALGYAVLLHAAPFRPLTLPPAVRSLASLAAAALCWSYCRTNLHSLSVRWAALSGRARHLGAARGALTALVLLPLGLLPGGTSLVLLGPGTATAALFLVVLAAALSRRHPLPDRAEPPSSTASTASTESSASSLSTSRTSRTSHSPYLPSISRTS